MKKLYARFSIGSKTYLKTLIVFTFIISGKASLAQDFTWMRGSPFSGTIASVYGTQGVSSPLNDPGSRHGANTWVDTNGDLWLFGGEGPDLNWHSDLWKYTVSTNEWTFIQGNTTPNQPSVYGAQGVASATNNPGAREFSFSWVDAQGKFWLFGGDGYASVTPQTYAATLADLWKYDPVTNEWTFVKGTTTILTAGIYGTLGVPSSSTMPGARRSAASWIDASGNLWMYGGHGYDSSNSLQVYLNDLWKYTISTNQWTWMGGSGTGNQTSVNGTLGTAASTNRPGGVEFPAAWVQNGIFYMFGGKGFCSTPTLGLLNDMWKYDPSADLWTWIAGSNLRNQLGHYGTLGVTGSTVLPGGREAGACWKDPSGDLWLFGGDGYSSTTIGSLNDVFKYNLSTNQFTWVKGSNLPYIDGTYGTMGSSAASTIPGARTYNVYWDASKGNAWIFGGVGIDSLITTVKNNMQDLWKISVPCTVDSLVALPQASICSGETASLTAFYRVNSGVSWYLSANSGSAIATGTSLNTSTLYSGSTATIYTYYAEVASCSLSPRASITITVNPTPSITVSGPTSVCAPDVATLVATGASSYSWSGGAVGSSYTISPQITTNYTVTSTTTNNCIGSATISVPVFPTPVISVSGPTALCTPNSATLIATGSSNYLWSDGSVGGTNIINPQITSDYTVSSTNSFNCTGSATITIPVFPSPTIAVSGPTVLCTPGSATLSANGGSNYSWSGGHVGNTYTVNPQTTTAYTVISTTTDNCTGSATISINVSQTPTLALTTSSTIVCKGNSATLTASGATSYSWSIGQSTGNSIVVTPSVNTVYQVIGTDASHNCSAKQTVTISLCNLTSLASNNLSLSAFKLFPNPGKEKFVLEVSELPAGEMHFVIYNQLGQVVLTQKIEQLSSSIELQQANGIYFYRLISNNISYASGKLVVE